MTRPHCQNRDACQAKTPGKHCRSCFAKAVNADPAIRAKRSATMMERLADPMHRAAHRAACVAWAEKSKSDPRITEARSRSGREIGAKNIDKTRGAESRRKAGRACSATKLAHIPPSLRSEYRTLVDRRGISAAEAERIVKESAAQAARRDVQRAAKEMQAREERRRAQAY